ncbi:MAG: class I SAM-dependent methyltransferase [Actinobacteria bacterium]|nr:class I SAM-dependent methyltransferase [Actinomycetota bacterium]
MSRRRPQLTPWKAAGTRSEDSRDADEVVRQTGWVFNNETGSKLSLAQFVATGDLEVRRYLKRWKLKDTASTLSILEIGSGIGRMTAAFSREFASVVATDVDAAFLERCRETVARFGRPSHLRTAHIADGHTIPVSDASVDVVFSYITLQHCSAADALKLTKEAFRVVKPGGRVILNYRRKVWLDALLLPAGVVVRTLFAAPQVGERLSRWRWSTRLGWQANRVSPAEVFEFLMSHGVTVNDPHLFHHRSRALPRTSVAGIEVPQHNLDVAAKSHWWLTAHRG